MRTCGVLALERVHYLEVAQGTLVRMESERLRNTVCWPPRRANCARR